MNKKKLTIVFWLLVWGSILLAIILVIGLLLENKKSIMNLLKKEVSLPVTSNTPTMNNRSSKQCSIGEVRTQVKGVQGLELIGWTDHSSELSFYVFQSQSQELDRFIISGNTSSSMKINSQKLVCESIPSPYCYFPKTVKQKILKMQIQDNFGFALFSPSGDNVQKSWALLRLDGGLIQFHHSMGICGEMLPDDTQWRWLTSNDHHYLVGFSPQLPVVWFYSDNQLKSYSSYEFPTHPDLMNTFNFEKVSSSNCSDLKLKSNIEVENISTLNMNLIVLIKQSKSISSSFAVWKMNMKDQLQVISIDKIESSLFSSGFVENLILLPTNNFLFSVSNFFHTKYSLYEFLIDKRSVVSKNDWNYIPSETLVSRENTIRRSNEQLYFISYLDKWNSDVHLGNYEGSIINFPDNLKKELSPKVLLSDRNQSTKLILYQSSPGEDIKSFEVHCTGQ